MYNDYAARIQEKIEVEVSVSITVADLEVRVRESVEYRIAEIANATGVDPSRLSGVVSVEEPTPTSSPATAVASVTRVEQQEIAPILEVASGEFVQLGAGFDLESEPGVQRRLSVVQDDLNETLCNESQTRVLISILFSTADPAERDLFVQQLANMTFGDIPNATGTGDDGVVCAPMVIAEIARLVTPRPAAPPSVPPIVETESDQKTPLPPVPQEVWVTAVIIAGMLLCGCLCCFCAWLCAPAKKSKCSTADEEKQSLTATGTSMHHRGR